MCAMHYFLLPSPFLIFLIFKIIIKLCGHVRDAHRPRRFNDNFKNYEDTRRIMERNESFLT